MVRQKLSMKQQVAPSMSTILFIITGCGMGYMGSMEHPKALGDIVESAIGHPACALPQFMYLSNQSSQE